MNNIVEDFSKWLDEISQKIQVVENHDEIIDLCKKHPWLLRNTIPIKSDIFSEEAYNTLHVLTHFAQNDNVLTSLLRDFPEVMQYSKTSFGTTPLHLAIQNGGDHFHHFVFEYFSIEDNIQNLPLDNICNENAESITHFLAKYSEESLQEKLLKHPKLRTLQCGSSWAGFRTLFDILYAHGSDKIKQLCTQEQELSSTNQQEISVDSTTLLYRGHIKVTISKDDNMLIVNYIDGDFEGESIYNIATKSWSGASYGKELDHLVALYLLYDERTSKDTYV